MRRRAAAAGSSNRFDAIVADTRYLLSFEAFKPLVTDDAVVARHRSRHECCMTGSRDRDGMPLLRVRENSSLLQEAPEAVIDEEIGESFKVVRAELVDDDTDDQSRPRRLGNDSVRARIGKQKQDEET